LSVEGYVQEMIGRSVSEVNLGRMYIGWCAFF
jgi:phosphatidylinositol kinase/protein kinase (PI-3  family)